MNPTPTDKGRRLNVFYTTQVANDGVGFIDIASVTTSFKVEL
jgi:hypothetical protein